MRNTVKSILILFVFLSVRSVSAQNASNTPAGNIYSIYDFPQCMNGIIYDDNTWENKFGWADTVSEGRIVQKIKPLSYPFTINKLCFALTRLASGSPNWAFDIVVYDTTGTGGSPGQLVRTISSQTAANVPVYPNYAWYDFDNIDSIPRLYDGAYYIGLKWNPSVFPNHFIGINESETTPTWHVYTGSNSGTWVDLRTYLSLAQSVGIRADNSGNQFTHDYSVGPFLSLPCIFRKNQTYNFRARISNIGTSNETNVTIRFFLNNTMINFSTLSLLAGELDSVTFSWTPFVEGSYEIKIVTTLNTDQNRFNDTVSTSILVYPSLLVQTGTFNGCRNGLNLNIPDSSFVYDSILVTAPVNAYAITGVNIKIDTLIHTWDYDIVCYLIHNSTKVKFIDRVGSSGDNFIGTLLNDSACYSITSGVAPFTGSFAPSNLLSALNAYTNPSGYWKLKVVDTGNGGTGVLRAWCLTMSYSLWQGGIQPASNPSQYELMQNYPNPFNPSTMIEFNIPKAGNIKLTVYDLLGREVAVLVNEHKNPGIYSIDFDASALSSGVYFYKMESGSFTDTKKMLVIK